MIRASTEREKTLIKQAEDDLMLDFFLVLSDDPTGLEINRYEVIAKLINDARARQEALTLSN